MSEINLEDSGLKRKAFVKITGKDTGLWDCPGKGLSSVGAHGTPLWWCGRQKGG